MKPRTKDVLMNVYYQIYELYANISHDCCMGRLERSKVKWILDTLNDIEGYIYEKSNGS